MTYSSQDSFETIKERVRVHYGKSIQLSATSRCCSSGPESREHELYGAEAIETLPAGLVTTSYGCGNPFAIANLRRGDVVLDLGSGAGLDVLLAARIVGDEGRVYGLDMTDDMLEVAQRNAKAAGARNVVFLRGDIESIPLPNRSVDAIISNCVVNLAPNKHAAFTRGPPRIEAGWPPRHLRHRIVDGDLTGLPLDEKPHDSRGPQLGRLHRRRADHQRVARDSRGDRIHRRRGRHPSSIFTRALQEATPLRDREPLCRGGGRPARALRLQHDLGGQGIGGGHSVPRSARYGAVTMTKTELAMAIRSSARLEGEFRLRSGATASE